MGRVRLGLPVLLESVDLSVFEISQLTFVKRQSISVVIHVRKNISGQVVLQGPGGHQGERGLLPIDLFGLLGLVSLDGLW